MKPKFLRKLTISEFGESAEHLRQIALARQRGNSRPRRPYVKTDLVKPGYRYGGCEKKRHTGRRPFLSTLRNPKNRQKLAEAVIDFLKNTKDSSVTKEAVAAKLGVKTHHIEQIFHVLNRQGILAQEHRSFAHDTNREPMAWGCSSTTGWAGNRYDILREALATA